jgi:hypothetical protein
MICVDIASFSMKKKRMICVDIASFSMKKKRQINQQEISDFRKIQKFLFIKKPNKSRRNQQIHHTDA